MSFGMFMVMILAAMRLCAQLDSDLAAKAQRLCREGSYSEAIATADNAISSSTDRGIQARAHMVKGYTYLKLDNTDQAIAMFSAVTASYADLRDQAAEAQLRLAYLYNKKGDKVRAAAAFDHVADFQPSDPSIVADAKLRSLGLKCSLARSGSIPHSEALTAGENLVSAYPDDKRIQNAVRVFMAGLELERDQPLEAIRQARLAISAYPALSYPDTYSGDFAPFDLTTSYDTDSEDDQIAWAKVYIACATEVRKWEYFAQAVQSFDQMLTEHPNAAVAREEAEYRRAEALYKQGKYLEAASGFETFIGNHPQNASRCAWSYYMWGKALNKLDATAKSIEKLKKAVSDYPSQVEAVGRARLVLAEFEAFRYGRRSETIPVLLGMIGDYTNVPDVARKARSLLTQVYYVEHQYDAALLLARAVLSDYPGGLSPDWVPEYVSEAQYMIATCLMQKKDRQGAMEAFNKLVNDYPKNAEAKRGHYYLAGMYAEDRQYAQAVQEFDRALQLSVTSPIDAVEYQYQKAICLKASGDTASARIEFQKVIDGFPDSHLAMRAREQLAKL